MLQKEAMGNGGKKADELFQGTSDMCTLNSVPIAFIVFSRDSWAYIGISHRGTLGPGVHPTIP